MREVRFPNGFLVERLSKSHHRKAFTCGKPLVDEWLATKSLQNQEKHLTTTKVLLDENREIAGFFTLATGQVDFGDLPPVVSKKLPRRMLPVAVIAWLGVAVKHQGKGLGQSLLALALRDCYEAGQIFSFIAVILDCIDDDAKAFYQRFDFTALPGNPYRLYLAFEHLKSLMIPS